jgi:hypothetical protein
MFENDAYRGVREKHQRNERFAYEIHQAWMDGFSRLVMG